MQGYAHFRGITADSPPVSEAEADKWLRDDLAPVEAWIGRFIRYELHQSQYDALCSLCFQCGPDPLKQELGAYVNNGHVAGFLLRAADEFHHWILDKDEVCEEFVKRRQKERALFLLPVIVANNGLTA